MGKVQRKKIAITAMKRMKIYEPYIQEFKERDTVCIFENFAGFWAYQREEIQNKIREIEKNYNCTVYAITHEYTNIGECYDFLIVSNYPEEWDDLIRTNGNNYYVFAYVWNKTDEVCSEFGDIGVKSYGGGIRRFA